ncbi:MAG: hypothetical protein Q8W47_00260 [Candidatus Palauibacterales bacterium]|nr:hypothetical protein [Candidatus Palauibacterales bacterium]
MERERSLGEDLRWGLKWAVAWAVFCTIIAVVMVVLGGLLGSDPLAELSKEAQGWGATRPLSWTRLLGFYFGVGPVIGLLVGLMRPLATSSRWRAALVGAVCTPVGWAMFYWSMTGFHWTRILTGGIGLAFVPIGPIYGLAFWYGWQWNRGWYEASGPQEERSDERSEAQRIVDDVLESSGDDGTKFPEP